MRQKPKKSLGQNFLIDRNIQDKIIQSCDLDKNDTVLEIGPGRGEISELLLPRVKKLISVEIDRQLCAILKDKFSNYSNFKLINADILETDLSLLAGRKKLKIIANLPYYISTPIITHLIQHRKSISEIFLTLQKELAQRLTGEAGSKNYGAFSCFIQFYTQVQILFPIHNSSFWPKPKVDSRFIKLGVLARTKIKVRNEDLLFKIIRLAFNQRRKMLKNNLSRMFPESEIISCLESIDINIHTRAEDLSLSDFAKLAESLDDK